MRIILLKDVENLGKKYDIKEVKAGFARNFLIPKGLAKSVTRAALKWLKLQKEIEVQKSEEELKRFQSEAAQLDGLELVIPVKVGEEKQLFESIGTQKILEVLKEKGFEIKKNQIELESPLKELGEFPVKLHFEHNLEAEIRVILVGEKE